MSRDQKSTKVRIKSVRSKKEEEEPQVYFEPEVKAEPTDSKDSDTQGNDASKQKTEEADEHSLPDEVCSKIIAMAAQGIRTRLISQKLHLSYGQVSKVLQHYQEMGCFPTAESREEVTTDIHKCPFCSGRYKTQRFLYLHMKSCHRRHFEGIHAGSLQCPHCGKKCDDIQTLKAHQDLCIQEIVDKSKEIPESQTGDLHQLTEQKKNPKIKDADHSDDTGQDEPAAKKLCIKQEPENMCDFEAALENSMQVASCPEPADEGPDEMPKLSCMCSVDSSVDTDQEPDISSDPVHGQLLAQSEQNVTKEHTNGSLQHPSENQSHCDCCSQKGEWQRKILTVLESQTAEIQDLKHMLMLVVRKMNFSPDEAAPLPDGIEFPICSQGQMDELERRLLNPDVERSIVHHLSFVRGKNSNDVIANIMKAVFSQQMAKSYCWMGRVGRKPFHSLRLHSIISRAIRKNAVSKGATDSQIKKIIQHWFKSGPRPRWRQPSLKGSCTESKKKLK